MCVTTFGGIFDKCSVNHARATWIAATRCRARATVLLSRRNDRQSQLNYKFSHSLCSLGRVARPAKACINNAKPITTAAVHERRRAHARNTHTHSANDRAGISRVWRGGGDVQRYCRRVCVCRDLLATVVSRSHFSRITCKHILLYESTRVRGEVNQIAACVRCVCVWMLRIPHFLSGRAGLALCVCMLRRLWELKTGATAIFAQCFLVCVCALCIIACVRACAIATLRRASATRVGSRVCVCVCYTWC